MEEEIFDAEIIQAPGANSLNITLGATIAVSIIILFLGVNFSQVATDTATSNQST